MNLADWLNDFCTGLTTSLFWIFDICWVSTAAVLVKNDVLFLVPTGRVLKLGFTECFFKKSLIKCGKIVSCQKNTANDQKPRCSFCMANEPPQFQNFGIPPIWSSLSTTWKYCYPYYCFLTPQFQTFTNPLILIFWRLVISLNYITINNITALVQCNAVLFSLDILCLWAIASLKRLLNPPQIHHCL